MSVPLSKLDEPAAAVPPMTILIADDHWVVRESLRQVARSLGANGDVEEAASFDEALSALERNPTIGLVIIDLVMPGFRDFEGLQVLRNRFPAVPVVIVSVYEDPEHVLEAIRHGVVGYIPKSYGPSEIKHALSRVMAGEVAFPRDILTRAHGPAEGADGRRGSRDQTPAPSVQATDMPPGFAQLTRRETEVLAALGKGVSLQAISSDLDISRQTVRVHLGNAMKKLNIATREAIIRLAVENADYLSRASDAD
ncbi:response regulator [Zavarzinia sp.]|uniref:response regulator transcription factor n=1 Tax=Zavarzinia sp. TaxID=2027920 RepID=UPI0035622C0B